MITGPMNELKFQVLIDEKLERQIQGAVAFGDFVPGDEEVAIYHPSEAPLFLRDLILGRPLPLVFATRKVEDLGVLLAITLFLHRELAIHPVVPGLMTSMNLVDTCGVAGLAHMDRDLSRFLRFLHKSLKATPNKDSLAMTVGLVRSYILEGAMPALPPEKEPPQVIERGTDGFVFAMSSHEDLSAGWEELFRMGFLRGALMCRTLTTKGNVTDRWCVRAMRKSRFLAFDLDKAASALNDLETAIGEDPGWRSYSLSMTSSPNGTLILPSDFLGVLLRV